MNFLAHIYLSGENELIRIGNFMADGIRGKSFEAYPEEVRTGILLHREIDTFTDAHPLFRLGTKRLHADFHHYAGVIVDVFYDHFLAASWNSYHEMPLREFAATFYASMHRHYGLLTDRAKNLLPVMTRHDWLTSYATLEGISEILRQMDRRTGNRSKMSLSPHSLELHYDLYAEEFTQFFTDIRLMAQHKLQTGFKA